MLTPERWPLHSSEIPLQPLRRGALASRHSDGHFIRRQTLQPVRTGVAASRQSDGHLRTHNNTKEESVAATRQSDGCLLELSKTPRGVRKPHARAMAADLEPSNPQSGAEASRQSDGFLLKQSKTPRGCNGLTARANGHLVRRFVYCIVPLEMSCRRESRRGRRQGDGHCTAALR